MAKSLDNVLRTMNEYLKDMFDIFGGTSTEYSRAHSSYIWQQTARSRRRRRNLLRLAGAVVAEVLK